MRNQTLSIGVGILALVLASPAMADLDAAQKRLLADAVKQLDQGEANFKVAKDGVAGQVTPSKAKLALSRLAAVKGSIAQAAARVEKLPATDAAVGAAQARLTALQKSVTDLEDSLTKPQTPANAPVPGKAVGTDAPAAPTTPAAPAGGARLDYRQAESLKNADFHTSTVTASADALAKLAKQVQAAPDPSGIDYQQLAQGMNTLEDARRKAKNAADHLAKLPPDGAGVAEVAAALKIGNESLDASEKVIAPAFKSLTATLDPKSMPTLAADTKRLQELGQMYSDTQILQRRYEQAAELVSQLGESTKEHDRIVKQYAVAMSQETDAGKRLTGASRNFKEKQGEFAAAAEEKKKSLPAEIDGDIASIGKLADQAVAEQKPAFFPNGIADRLQHTNDKMTLLAALDPAAAKTQAAKLDQLRATLKDRQASLKDGIIAANALPNDQYTQADRKALETLAVDAWKKEQPDAQVLAIRIPSSNWTRETMWRYENQWNFIDRSKLQVQLVVKQDDKLAVVRPVNLRKDHTSNDDLKAYPMDSAKDALEPQRFLLIDKVK